MKKIFGFIAMALALAACNKNEMNVQSVENNEGIPFSATISVGNNAATRALTESGSDIVATWAAGEKVALIHNGVNDEMTVSSVSGGVATITGTITGSPSDGDPVTVIYPSSAADGTTGNVKADLLYAQNGLLTGTGSIAEKYDVRKGAGTLKVSGTASLNGNVSLTNQFAIFKFTIKKATVADATIDVTSLTVSIGSQNYIITPASATSILYVALPAVSGQPVIFTANGNDSKTYSYSKANVTIAAGKYYQSPLKLPVLGLFTIDGSSRVAFAPGNLQATYDGSLWNWHFADHQWDYIGNNPGNTSITGNGTVSTNNVTVDLFGWVGVSSSFTGAALYGISNSKTNSDYGTGSGEALKSDWGTTIGSVWRTLTKAEWVHMLNTRSVNGGTGKGHSYTLGQSVNGKLGLVIYPDSYTGSEYAGSDWATFESLGCVFLPVTGYRSGTTVSSPDAYGVYWTGSSSGDSWAEYIYFTNSSVNTGSYTNRYTGCSVRLARVVE